MHAWDALHFGDDLALLRVVDHHTAGPEVGNVQSVGLRIDALIVEPRSVARQWHVSDGAKADSGGWLSRGARLWNARNATSSGEDQGERDCPQRVWHGAPPVALTA